MEVRTLFLIAIGTLGFLSGLLSFIAEGKKLAESDITRLASDECVHTTSPALGLGLAAAIALLFAQIISNSLGGCICCELGVNDPSGKFTPVAVAISCLTLSWVTFSIAFLLLVAGASINDKRDASDNNLSTGCYVLKSGVFTGAAFASMTTAILGVTYNLQVFAIRKSIAAAVPGAVDGSPSSSAVGLSSIAATTVFASDQRQKARMMLDHTTAYPRSAVNPYRVAKSMKRTSPQFKEALADEEMVNNPMRTHAKTEISGGQPSKEMRKTLVLQQLGSNVDQGEDRYGSHKASQSASASYEMDSTDPSCAHFVGNSWGKTSISETGHRN